VFIIALMLMLTYVKYGLAELRLFTQHLCIFSTVLDLYWTT